MKLIVAAVLALVAAAALAAPAEPPKILRFDNEQSPEGAYNFNFESDDGISRQEEGQVKEVKDEENKPHTVVVQRGSYSYPDPEGNIHTATYYADENGFHIESPDVPKAASN